MPEANFQSLQNMHESLLQKQQKVSDANRQDFAREVKDYIEQAKRSGSKVSSTRERDQIRANLRYWANYVYGIEGLFPDTELAPSTITDNQSFWGTSLGKLSVLIIGVIGLLSTIRLAGFSLTPSSIDATTTVVFPTTVVSLTPTSEFVIPVTNETPTSLFVGSDVVLTEPANGANVHPVVLFKGAYTNLKAESTIHVLLIRGDKFYPAEGFFKVLEGSATGEWEIKAALYRNGDELEQAENLIVAPAACFDQPCRDTLADAVQDGIAISSLPTQLSFNSFEIYRDSSRVMYRNAYQAVLGTKLVYSMYKDTSYDLYVSEPDGSDIRKITSTSEFSEMYPNLSPDGTKIVYVRRFRDPVSNSRTYALSIMDSNGENDHEITDRTKNVIENPQWSPDSAYISYAVVESVESSNAPFSTIHAYDLSSQEDKIVSGDPERLVNRYATWIPDTNIIVFDAAFGNRTRFVQTPVESQDFSIYFDPKQYVSQPSISFVEGSYLLTYIVAGAAPEYLPHIYAAVDSDGELPFGGDSVPLIESTGERLDYPRLYPEINYLYYTKYGSIYGAEYQITDGQITLIRKPNTSLGGVEVIKNEEIGDRVEPIYYDIHYIEAYFPIP